MRREATCANGCWWRPRAVALAAILLMAIAGASAQEFPSKPIRLVVPYPAGGTTDLMARVLKEPMQQVLGQPIVIVNNPGAAGITGSREVARAPADGYTILFVIGTQLMVTPLIAKDAGYSTQDFVPIGRVATVPLYAMVNAAVPVDNFVGFIEYARRQPNAVEYASSGIGSTSHLATEMLARAAGIKLLHVPYKGTAPATQAVVTGEVKLVITSGSSAMHGYIESRQLKLMGITSAMPSPLAPTVSPLATAVPGYSVEAWSGLFAPAGTSPAVVSRLNDALQKALQGSDVKSRFETFGVGASASTSAELAAAIVEEGPRWAAAVRDVGLRPQ